MSQPRCRSCDGDALEVVLSLGRTPLANALLTREQLEKAYVKFLEVADRKKRVEDQDLISIHESAHSVVAG